MPIEQLHLDQLVSCGFDALPAQLYAPELLPMVPNQVNTSCFRTAFLMPGKGRVVLYNNPSLYIDGKKAMALGHFECIQDSETARDLLLAAEKEALKAGAEYLIGPMNGSTWDNYRFSLDHNNPQFFTETYHHLYYNDLWKEAGFSVIGKYDSKIDKALNLFASENLSAQQNRLEQMQVHIRPIRLEHYEQEISSIHGFCSRVFGNNFLYTPVANLEFIRKYSPVQLLIDPDLVLVAEDREKNIVAIFFTLPDLYDKRNTTLVCKTIARDPGRQFAGLTHIMCNRIIKSAIEKGYTRMIHAFMHRSNESNNMSAKFSGEIYRQYVLYGKQVTGHRL